jgi:hypothetical protein
MSDTTLTTLALESAITSTALLEFTTNTWSVRGSNISALGKLAFPSGVVATIWSELSEIAVTFPVAALATKISPMWESYVSASGPPGSVIVATTVLFRAEITLMLPLHVFATNTSSRAES